MKIAIATIIDNDNYGNRLQNYAAQQMLSKKNNAVYTLKNNPLKNNKLFFIIRNIRYYKRKIKIETKRNINFSKFNELINFHKKEINAFSLHRTNFDYYIVGSDQVWNPKIGRLKDFDLLVGVPTKKRISLSASFGIEKIPKKYINKTQNELKKFKAISVREDRGKEIVEELTGRKDIKVLVDPTMLLTAEEWDEVSKKPAMLKNDKFILNYFLGEISEERKKEIERVAKENDCEIINILDKNSPFYECGPSEFLYLEKNAFLICTDSFHSSVFAILYNRPFVIFDREQKNVTSMNSRLDTLINKFKLKNRKFEGKITEKNLKHNYEEAYKILEKERQKSERFLKEALDIKE